MVTSATIKRRITRSKNIKKSGAEGESRVEEFLQSIPNTKVLSNLVLKQSGKFSQIDHVLVTSSCIYVIETKNHSGKVNVREAEKIWWVYYPTGKKYKLYNPITQNSIHLKRIASVVTELPIKSVVLFSHEECILSKSVEGVYLLDDFKNYIGNITSDTVCNTTMDEVVEKLNTADKSDDEDFVKQQLKYAKSHRKYS